MYIKKKNGVHRGAYVLERIPAGHLLLKLFLELFPCPDGLLVADILRKLLQACLGEILGEVLDTLLIGREQLLKEQSVRWSLHRMRRFQMKSRKFYHHTIEGRTGGKAQTISLLSMLTFRRLAATALMSFSFIQDLKSFTANAAETPVKERSLSNRSTCLRFSKSSQSSHSPVLM